MASAPVWLLILIGCSAGAISGLIGIVGEERYCRATYGSSYVEYLKKRRDTFSFLNCSDGETDRWV
jgi:protein-S-isoprenylcysteine O-methyltransferase Ste14